MANIQHHVFAQITGSIYGVAGYYSENDSTQHVIVATTDGKLYETHWNQSTTHTPLQALQPSPGSAPWQFREIASLGGFSSWADDRLQHVMVATHDGSLQELYFEDPLHVQLHTPRPLFHLGTTLGPGVGMAAFYSSEDQVHHATVGGADNILHEVVWGGSATTSARNLATQFTMSDVAAIAGFFDLNVHSRNVIVAMEGGDVYNVHYSGGILAGGQIITTGLTSFSLPTELVNVAAFVNLATHNQHVIVLDASGQLYDYTYVPHHEGLGEKISLTNLAHVVDIAAYYSHYDTTCHVIAATQDGNLHEVYYADTSTGVG